MPIEPSTSHTFVVRVWLEPVSGEEAGEWRGEVRSVPGGDGAYFRGLEGACAALRRAMEEQGIGNRE